MVMLEILFFHDIATVASGLVIFFSNCSSEDFSLSDFVKTRTSQHVSVSRTPDVCKMFSENLTLCQSSISYSI